MARSLLRPFLLVVILALASSIATAQSQHDKDFWRAIYKNHAAVPQNESADALAQELGAMVALPDPELRDELSYSILATWVYRGNVLSTPTLLSLTDAWRANLKLGLGEARGLKIELIKDRIVVLRHDRGRPNRPARPIRNTEADHRPEALRTQECGVPRDGCSPIVTGDHRLIGAESVEEAHHVADKMQQRILVYRLGALGLAIAAHVGRHRVEAGFGERR